MYIILCIQNVIGEKEVSLGLSKRMHDCELLPEDGKVKQSIKTKTTDSNVHLL